MKKLSLCLAVLGFCLAPQVSSAQTDAARLKVVASFSIIGDFARQVGGDHIDLTTLVGPNGDPHVYEIRPADITALNTADVVLVNGHHFEAFLDRLGDLPAKAPFTVLSKGAELMTLKAEHAHHDSGAGEDTDPHAFQSIANARIYVNNIADAFCAADATGCSFYRTNAAAYQAKLSETEAQVKAELSALPADRREIVTSHDAFGYFGKEYGMNFIAPEGVATESEASAADIAAVIRQVRDEKASAIFLENISNRQVIDQIASETGLSVGGKLYSDALSGSGEEASSYIAMMLHNARTIKNNVLANCASTTQNSAPCPLPSAAQNGMTIQQPGSGALTMDIRQLDKDFSVTGQITVEDVKALKAAGYRTIISNRPDGEQPGQPGSAEIAAAATAEGMTFVYVPVDRGQITDVEVQAMSKALHDAPRPILAYCRSGTRSTNLYYAATQPDGQ